MAVTISRLAVEHYESGFGVGTPSPRLSWRFEGDSKDWVQTSYDIVITRADGKHEYHVDSSDSVLVPWPCRPVESREVVKVAVRSNGCSSTPWATLDVEAALLNPNDWQASPISCESQPLERAKQPFRLRRRFSLKASSRCRLYVTALGVYEVHINGQRVGDHVLAPGWTDYKHHLDYQIFDVTSLVHPGDNVIEAYVAEGWYSGRLGFRGGARNIYGNRNALVAQLETDGQVAVCTDESWQWSYGPIITSEIYDGEVYDSRATQTQTSWRPGEVIAFPTCQLTPSQAPPVRQTEDICAEAIIRTPQGKMVVDFGQNLVGWVRLNRLPKGLAGSKVVTRHAEVLENGELGVRPLRQAKATDTLILGGDMTGYEPRFTFHGFRYIDIEGWDDQATLTDFTAVVIHTDMERRGFFSCSHPLINQLHSNIVWSMRGNFLSIPTDCPQRDERLGWTGDLQVFCPTAAYLYDVSGILDRWLKDVAAEQLLDYEDVPPVVVPNVIGARGLIPLAIWADVTALTPWDLYTAFGDQKFLTEQYVSMTAWLDRGVKRGPSGLWDPAFHQLGDWLDPMAPPASPAMGATDTMLVADAYLVHVTRVVAKISKLVGRSEDQERYEESAKKLLAAFHAEYVTPNGRLMSDSQCALALALNFDLALEDDLRQTWADRLDYLVRNSVFKVATGFAGTPIILDTLTRHGKLHLAYRMLQEKQCPSWLYPVSMGATTIWERWDSMLPSGDINPGQMTSFNHYALGSVATFLHGVVGGISPLEPGWRKILVRPQPGGTVTHASAKHLSPYGTIECSWKIINSRLQVRVCIPPNATARVVLPGVDEEIGSGIRDYEVRWEEDPRWPPRGIQLPFTQPIVDEFV